VRAGDEELARAEPRDDLALEVPIPAAALDRSGGRLTIETSRVFVPAERSASPDRRALGLRVFEFDLRAVGDRTDHQNLIAGSLGTPRP
jgi:hypothetical protein